MRLFFILSLLISFNSYANQGDIYWHNGTYSPNYFQGDGVDACTKLGNTSLPIQNNSSSLANDDQISCVISRYIKPYDGTGSYQSINKTLYRYCETDTGTYSRWFKSEAIKPQGCQSCPIPEQPIPMPEGGSAPIVGDYPDCDISCPVGYTGPFSINDGLACLPECLPGETFNSTTLQCETNSCALPQQPSPMPEGAVTPTVGEMPDCPTSCPDNYVMTFNINGGDTCMPENPHGCENGEYWNGSQCNPTVDCTTKTEIESLCIPDNLYHFDQPIEYQGCKYIECSTTNPDCTTSLYATNFQNNHGCRLYKGTGESIGISDADNVDNEAGQTLQSSTNIVQTGSEGLYTITDTTMGTEITYNIGTSKVEHAEAIDNSIDQLLTTQPQYDTDRDNYPEEYQTNTTNTAETINIDGTEYTVVRHVDEPTNTGQPYDITNTSTATDGNGNTTTSTTTTTVNPVDGEDSGGIYTVYGDGTGTNNGDGSGTNNDDGTGTNNGDGTGTNNGDGTVTDTTAIESKLDTANSKLAKIQEGLDGSGSNVSFDCKVQPACDSKVVTCANLKQEWFTACGGTDAIETAKTEAITALGEGGDANIKDINIAAIITDITNFDVTASCPPDVSKIINLLSSTHSLTIKSEPYCTFATTIRPAVLMVGSFLVLLIIARTHR